MTSTNLDIVTSFICSVIVCYVEASSIYDYVNTISQALRSVFTLKHPSLTYILKLVLK
jgi:hypothetical protein